MTGTGLCRGETLPRGRPLASAPELCDVTKGGHNQVKRADGQGVKDTHPVTPSVDCRKATGPPMRKPSEMSNSGFVILNRTSGTTAGKDTTRGVKWVSSIVTLEISVKIRNA
jgi:hypothetical protein